MITSMMDHIKISKSSTYKKDSPKAKDATNLVPNNKKSVMWNLKHDISSPKFY